MKSNGPDSKILIIHDIRSAQNVGALFRTADAAGIDHIYLSSITPQPIDRFGRPMAAIVKTALGAEQHIAWTSYGDIYSLINTLQNEGVSVIAIEQSPSAVDYKTVSPQLPVAFIVGNEVTGIPQEVLDRVDITAVIPMQGTKESLNVSVAGGIALFRILNI
jgi:tRNA G18 (ribose-2'-O)-methylase SpoU